MAGIFRTDNDGQRYLHADNGADYYIGCEYCQREKAKGNSFFPPHKPSDRCESGKRNHCSCGVCF